MARQFAVSVQVLYAVGAGLLLISACSMSVDHQDVSLIVEIDRVAPRSTGPDYNVRAYADGSVRFEGRRNTAVAGEVKIDIGPERIEKLLEHLRREGFWDLKDRYAMSPSDLDTTRVTATWRGRTKTVTNYWTGGEKEAWLRVAPQLEDEDWEGHAKVEAIIRDALSVLEVSAYTARVK